MSMTANPVLLQKKYARVIKRYAEKYHVTEEEALACFYKSQMYQLVSRGVSDLHCMSDDYLTEELHDEWAENVRRMSDHQAGQHH